VLALVIFHSVICAFLVLVILLQPGKGDAGIGFGSSSQSIFGSKGAGNFLTKTTTFAAIAFLATSFFLTKGQMDRMGGSKSVITAEDPAAPAQAPSEPQSPVPAPVPVEGKEATPTK